MEIQTQSENSQAKINKKLLILLWLIIMGGGGFIIFHKLKPEPIIEQKIETSTTETSKTENTKTTETKAPEEKTKTYTEYLSTGDKFLQNGYVKSAIEEYQKAADVSPNSLVPKTKLANAYLLDNNPKQAELTFKEAEKIAPESLSIKIGIIKSYLNQRDAEKAKALLSQLDRNDPEVKLYAGIILILYDELDQANTTFIDIVTNNADNKEIVKKAEKFTSRYKLYGTFKEEERVFLKLLLAKAMTEIKEYESAIPLLYSIISEKNNYRDAWIILGFSYLNVNKLQDAIDALLQAKELDQTDADTMFFLGIAYSQNNDLEKAIFYMEKAKSLNYIDLTELEIQLGKLYIKKENYQKAEEKYLYALSKKPKNLTIIGNLFWLYSEKLNSPDKAFEMAQKALVLNPENASSLNMIGKANLDLKNYKKAKEYLLLAKSKDPILDLTYFNLAQLYEIQGFTTLSREHYKQAYLLSQNSTLKNIAYNKYRELYSGTQIQTNTLNSLPGPSVNPPVLP